MPFVHIRIASAEPGPEQIEILQRGATHLMASVMRKKAELTAVLVETHDPTRWSIGGQPVLCAAHLDVKVTAGTNSADEKAEFVRQAHDLLRSAFSASLPLATYVVVDEVAADAWGYGGLTQEARRIAVAQPWRPDRECPVRGRSEPLEGGLEGSRAGGPLMDGRFLYRRQDGKRPVRSRVPLQHAIVGS